MVMLAGIALDQNDTKGRHHQGCSVFFDSSQPFTKPVPSSLTPAIRNRLELMRRPPACIAPPSTIGSHHRWLVGDWAAKQAARCIEQDGEGNGQWHAGKFVDSSLRIASGQTRSFIMLGRFIFAAVLSLWRLTGEFTLRHSWPSEYWYGVRTSDVSEGLFRGKINPGVVGDRLEYSPGETFDDEAGQPR